MIDKQDLARLDRELERRERLRADRRNRRYVAPDDLYEHAPDMHFSADAISGRILHCNATFSRVTGFALREVIGRHELELYHPDCHHRAGRALRSFRETGAIADIGLVVRRKSGGTVDVSLGASAVRDARGTIVATRSTWRDISARRAADQALRQSRNALERQLAERTRALLDAHEAWRREALAREKLEEVVRALGAHGGGDDLASVA